MGVKGLWNLLEPTGRPVSLEALEGKVLAVDVSIWLNQAMYGIQGHQQSRAHLVVLFNRICKLLFYKIKPIFVFDGTAPELKKHTLNARRKRKELAVARAQRATDRIVKNYLKSHALNTVSKAPRSKGRKAKLSSMLPRTEKEASLFELPPLPENTKQSTRTILDEKEDRYLDRIDQQKEVEAQYQDLDDIDINSEEFRGLSEEIQHEVITNIRETRRKPFWSRYEQLPKKADDFSSYQLGRLLKKGKMSHRLDELQKEMKTKTSGDLAVLLDYETRLQAFEAGRVASEDTQHYILIKKDEQSIRSLGDREEDEAATTDRDGSNEAETKSSYHSSDKSQSFLHAGMDLEKYFEANVEFDDIYEVDSSAALQEEAPTVTAVRNSGELNEMISPSVTLIDSEQAVQDSREEANSAGPPKVATSPETYKAIKHEVWKFFSQRDGQSKMGKDERRGAIVDEEDFRGVKRGLAEEEGVVSPKKFKNGMSDFATVPERVASKPVTYLGNQSEDDGEGNSHAGDNNEKTDAYKARPVTEDMKEMVTDDAETSANLDKGDIEVIGSRDNHSIDGLQKELKPSRLGRVEVDNVGTNTPGNVSLGQTEHSIAMETEAEAVESVEKRVTTTREGPDQTSERNQEIVVKNEKQEPTEKDNKEGGVAAARRSSRIRRRVKTDTSTDVRGGHSESKSEKLQLDLEQGSRHSEVRASGFRGESEVNLSDEYDSEEEARVSQRQHGARKVGPEESSETAERHGSSGEAVEGAPKERRASSGADLAAVAASKVEGDLGAGEEVAVEKLHDDDNPPVEAEIKAESAGDEAEELQQKAIEVDVTSLKREPSQPEGNIFSSEFVEDSETVLEDSVPGEILTAAEEEELDTVQNMLAAERFDLEKERSKGQKLAASVTEAMYTETKELLVMFGLPYIESPQEAEAQCAYLDLTGQCEGTITDDSDVWLFGGQRVYKNFFTKDKDVLFFHDQTIERQLTLDRYKMINLGLLMGSDYTIGVQGVGAVTAMEIISEFPGQGVEGLEEFREWWDVAKDSDVSGIEPRVRTKFTKFHIPSNFPSPVVVRAYLDPEVDKSAEKFTWRTPDLDLLRTYAEQKLGWIRSKTDNVLLPVMKKMREKVVQGKISSYFFLQPKADRERQKIKSKRVEEVLQKLSGASPVEPETPGESGEPTAKRVEPKGRKQSKDVIRKSQEAVSVSDESDEDRADVARIARGMENHRGRHSRIGHHRKLFAKNNKGIGRSWKKQSFQEQRRSDDEAGVSLVSDQEAGLASDGSLDREEGEHQTAMHRKSSGSKVVTASGDEIEDERFADLGCNFVLDQIGDGSDAPSGKAKPTRRKVDAQQGTKKVTAKRIPENRSEAISPELAADPSLSHSSHRKTSEDDVSRTGPPAAVSGKRPSGRRKEMSTEHQTGGEEERTSRPRRGRNTMRMVEQQEEYRIEDEIEPEKDEKEIRVQARKRARRNPYLKKAVGPKEETGSPKDSEDKGDREGVAGGKAGGKQSRGNKRSQLLDKGPKNQKRGRGRGKGKQLLNSRTRFKSLQQYSQLNLSESSSSEDE